MNIKVDQTNYDPDEVEVEKETSEVTFDGTMHPKDNHN